MHRFSRIALAVTLAIGGVAAHAVTIKEAAQQAVLNNPEVQAKWHVFKEASEHIDAVRGGYLPRVDLGANIARERYKDGTVTPETSVDYTTRGIILQLNQMLFDGFATPSEVKRLSYAQRAAYFDLLDTSETTALEAYRAYNDVLRYRTLLKLAQDNYVYHRAVFEQIEKRVQAGVGRRVDLEQASGRLALAESNMLTEAANLHDVSARYQRIVGVLPTMDMAELAQINAGIPSSKNDALVRAYELNPALASSMENIVSAQAGLEGVRAKFMPRLDLRAKKELNWDAQGANGKTDMDSIGLLLNYNLFNGGSDMATRRQYAERVNIAKDLRDKTCRDIRQTLYIAHNDIQRLDEQVRFLDAHQLATEKALQAYRRQFDIGQRTLLDLLDTENELFEAKRAYVNGTHDQMLARARTHASMGTLLSSLDLQRLETPGLKEGRVKAEFDPATVCPPDAVSLVNIDKDRLYADAIAANPDLVRAATPAPAPVAAPEPVKPAPSAVAPTTVAPGPVKLENAKAGDVVVLLKGVNFKFDSAKLRADAKPLLDNAVTTLNKRAQLKMEIAGHTDSMGSDAYNLKLSKRRAQAVHDYFVSHGLSAERFTVKGYGESKPVADNATAAGRAQNRRVELRILSDK